MAIAPKYVPVRITIPEEQNEWLMQHPEINLSGLVQSVLKEKMMFDIKLPSGFVTGPVWPADREPPNGWKFVEEKK